MTPDRPIVLKAATCTTCGHLLRGLTPAQKAVVCPECGSTVVFDLRTPVPRPETGPYWRGTSLLTISLLAAVLIAVLVILALV